MATGLKSYIEVQIAKESTAGTPVTPTSRLHGVYNATQNEDRTKIRPEELRGTLTRMYRSITVGRLGRLNLEGTALFQDLGHYLGMAIKGGVSGATDGGSPAAYKYLYAPTITSEDVPDTYTIRHVDRAGNFEFNYAFAQNIELSFAIDQLTNVRAGLLAQKRIVSSVQAGLAQRTVEDVVANNWTMYLDNTGGTIGATLFGGCITGGTWRIPNTFQAHKCISGQLYFTDVHQMPITTELDLTLEVNTTMLALLTQYEADTRVLVRLQNAGSIIRAAATAPGAPTVAAHADAGVPSGTYQTRVTFYNAFGETEGGTVAPVTVVSKKIDWSSIPLGPAGTVGRKLYRSPAAGTGAQARLIATLADNTTTVYVDNIADATVATGALVPTTNTSAATNRLRVDGAYQIVSIGDFGASEQQGVNTVQLQLRGEYDPTWGKLYEVELYNALSALP